MLECSRHASHLTNTLFTAHVEFRLVKLETLHPDRLICEDYYYTFYNVTRPTSIQLRIHFCERGAHVRLLVILSLKIHSKQRAELF